MVHMTFSMKSLLFVSRFILRRLRNPRSIYRKNSNAHSSQFKLQKYPSLSHRSELSKEQNLVFDVERALLKSSSLFPYFMLVAFEAGNLIRALVLLLLYPLVCLLHEDMGIKMMVMICFFGIKQESFRAGRAVLPKFFLEDVGLEGFQMLMKGGKRVGVSVLPRVMVESFLREYLEIEVVVGRELKLFHGYYVGLLEDKDYGFVLDKIIGEERLGCDAVGIRSFKRSLDHHLFTNCKDIYIVSQAEKRSWHHLPRENYPKPLIFHDGRLALRPTPLATISLFIWLPFAFCLAITRTILAISLPYKVSTLILAFSGLRLRVSKPNTSSTNKGDSSGVLYVCNHRSLLDPLYLSTALCRPTTAVTYSLSRVSELLSPVKTVRLTRDRDQDAKVMDRMLSQGDLVVCPEGTTCREPYLLRFSPLFAEMNAEVVPVALDANVSIFYGTTAGGLKCLDPLFLMMNPSPAYSVKVLQKLHRPPSSSTCCDDHHQSSNSSFEVANYVQKELGKALGFECTKLTRKDKYLMLAGNEGIVKVTSSNSKP
ncbi:hypothetical protein GIB67_001437 [Kingdonia uniflora]|uniref:Phospholipid/glycerol acyltransferase domain-containing protein n=1 Tax=Kingdonia uniflora TaxID=39325 RepID=A0A7J7L6Q5_9MAGN|nr:hypothetical protein GIB67_001437 [Kingdonia uniflora]